nr:hypothetical protein [Tanacetum cinerariifolium]
KILAQKAKIQWLSEGDINNKYFHQILKVRKNSSRIVSVCDAKRKWYNEDEFVEQFIKHFQTFLGGNGEDPIIEDAENLFTLKLSENEASAMTRDVTDMEIKEELLKGYKRKTSPQRCGIKIDIAKAYDTWVKMVIQIPIGCKEMGLTHMFFADDLLMTCHGDHNMKPIEKKRIIELIMFAEGRLPMKYLGVPLITKNLGIMDCNLLIEKVKSNLNDWKNKFPSYAGRLQLISSVLASMHIYRATIE